MANNRIDYTIGFNTDESGLQRLRSELQSINQMTVKELKLVDANATKKDLDEIKKSANILGEAIESSFNPKLGTLNVDKFNTSLKNSGQTVAQIEANFARLGTSGQTAFRNMTAEILTTQREVKQTNHLLDSMAQTLGNTIKWSIASTAIKNITGSIQKAWSYTKRLDESLNNIRIVTEKSSDDMEKFAKQANKAATALGASTTQYTNAALIYYQQGLDEEQTQARTEVTLKAANVTGQSAAEVSEQLTAVWNGYKVVAEEAELYIDKLAAVAASTAADLEELSDGMSKVASAANTMGVDIDQLSAQLATIVSVTREDASAVGTALKTIYARMGDLSVSGVDEFGVSLGDVSGQMRQMGTEVLDQNGNLREMGEIIEEVAKKWGTWTDAQQQAAAIAMAGKRQYNNLIALFENWDMYESALSTSKGSAGTLQKQQDIYMESIEAHLEQLSTAGERVYDAIFDSDSMKDFIDVLTDVVDLFAGFVESIGGGGNLLLAFGSIATQVFSDKIASGITRTLNNLNIMRQSIIQNRAELEIQEQYSDASDEAIKEMVAVKAKELKYEKLITQEQREQFELYIKKLAAAHNKEEEEKNKVDAAKKYYEERFGNTVDFDAKRSSENRVTTNKAVKDLEQEADNLESQIRERGGSAGVKAVAKKENQKRILLQSWEEFQGLNKNQLEDLQNQAEDDGDTDKVSAIQELIDVTEELKEKEKDLNKQSKNLIKTHQLSQEETNELIEVRKQYSKGSISLATYEKKLQEAMEKTAKKNRNVGATLKEGKKSIKEAEEKTNDLRQSYEEFSKNIDTTAMIQGFTKAASAIGSVVSAISMLKNIGNIWDNDTLSNGEKFLQTLTSISGAIGMGVTAYKSLKSGITEVLSALGLETSALTVNSTIRALNTSLKKAGTEEEKKELIQKFAITQGIKLETNEVEKSSAADLVSIVTKKLHGAANLQLGVTFEILAKKALMALLTMLPYILAIGALVGVIYGVKKAFDANGDMGQKAFEKASAAAESAANEYNRVKAAYDELKQSLEDYTSAQDAISNLTVGTEEWRQAIQDANSQVIELMNKYPQLAQYVDNVYGQLKISAAGQEAMLKAEEEKVNLASRANMAAQVSKLQAQNNMTSKQGANDAFNTEAKRNWAVASGVLVGGVAGLTGAAILSHKANEEEAAYDKVLELAAKDNSILSSQESLAKALEGTGYEKLADELWKNREALVKNSAAIEANNAAIKIQDQEIARSFLSETDDYNNLESEDQELLAKIVAKETGTDSQAYKDAMKKLGGGDIDKDEGKELAKQYADTMGIDAVETDYDDDTGVITYTDSSGNETKVQAKTAQIALAQQMAGAQVTDEYVENKIKQLNKLRDTINSTSHSFGDLAVQFAGGGESADLSSGNKKQIEEMQNAVDSYQKAYDEATSTSSSGKVDNTAKVEAGETAFAQAMGYKNTEEFEDAIQEMGYESIEEYQKAVQKSIDNYNKEKRKLTVGLGAPVISGLESLKEELGEATWEEFSLETQKIIASSLETAFEKGGQKGLDAFNKLIAEGGFNESEIQKIASAMGDIDWTSSGAINDLLVELESMGIEVDQNSDYWNQLTAAMEATKNVVQDVANNLSSLRSTLASISSLTKDLHLGDIISDEDYDTLVANNKELKKYFVMTADGYKYLGGADAEIEKAKNNVLDVNEIKENFDKAESAGKTLINKNFIKKDVKTGKISVKAGQQENLSKALASGTYDALLEASGYSAEQYKTSRDELTARSTYVKKKNGGSVNLSQINSAKNIDDLLSLLGFSSVQEYADTYTDGDWDLANEALNNALSDANTRITSANDYTKNAETAILNSLNSIQSGDWDQLSRDAQTSRITASVQNYSELKQYKNVLNTEDYNKLAITYLAEEAEQLGINTVSWEDYVAAVGNNIEKQEEYLNIIKELQAYDEVDYYSYITKAIEDAENELNKLSEAQDRAFGQEVLNQIEKQIEKLKELSDVENGLYKQRYEQKQKKIKLTEASFATDETTLNRVGLSIDLQDGVTSEEYDLIYQKMLSSEGDDRTTLIEILKKILDYNSLKEETEQEYEDAQNEAQNQILDLQIEQYETEIDLKKQLRESIKSWSKAARDLSVGIGKISAAVTLNNLVADYKKYNNTKVTTEGKLKSLEELQNHIDNGKANYKDANGNFDEEAYMTKYEELLEAAQNDVQELHDLAQDMLDGWIDSLNEISELYDEQAERLSTINSLLEKSAGLNKLLGNSSVEYYKQMRVNAQSATALYAAQEEKLKAEYGYLVNEDGTLKAGVTQDMADAAWEAYSQARQNHLDALQEEYDAIAAEFEARLQSIVDTAFSSAGGLNNFSELWELDKSTDEMYLDSVNAEYEKSKFERTVQKSIDSTDSITAQNKLNKVLKEQLKILEEKEKLSQYDLDHANAMYELTLKQIALEEAQQTANKMKLVRDAMGNYTYQYVTDEDQISEAEEELAAAENELYNLEKDHQAELIDSWVSTWQEYQELLIKYANDDTMLEKINERYQGIFGSLSDDLEAAGAVFGDELPQSWQDAFDTLSNIDSDNLLDQIGGLLESDGEIGSALDSLFGEEGKINTALNTGAETVLTAFVKGVDKLEEPAKELSTAMFVAAEELVAATANLKTFSENFNTSVNTYLGTLQSKFPEAKDEEEDDTPPISYEEQQKIIEGALSGVESYSSTSSEALTDIKDALIDLIPYIKNRGDNILPEIPGGNNLTQSTGLGGASKTKNNMVIFNDIGIIR